MDTENRNGDRTLKIQQYAHNSLLQHNIFRKYKSRYQITYTQGMYYTIYKRQDTCSTCIATWQREKEKEREQKKKKPVSRGLCQIGRGNAITHLKLNCNEICKDANDYDCQSVCRVKYRVLRRRPLCLQVFMRAWNRHTICALHRHYGMFFFLLSIYIYADRFVYSTNMNAYYNVEHRLISTHTHRPHNDTSKVQCFTIQRI